MTLLPLLSPTRQQVRGFSVVFLEGTETCWEPMGRVGVERKAGCCCVECISISLNAGRERDCSVFVSNLATKAFLVSFQFLGRLVSYPHNTLPYQGTVLFLLWSRTTLGMSSWSNHKESWSTKKPRRSHNSNICHMLEKVTLCSRPAADLTQAELAGLQHQLRTAVGKSGTILAKFQTSPR